MKIACAQTGCISVFSPLTSELTGCIISLYVNFILIGFLGIYLHDVIPQEFGVSQEPWVFRFFRRNKIEFRDEDEFRASVGEVEEDADS